MRRRIGSQRWIAQAADELDAYWRGASPRFDVPLDLAGTPFQRRVWHALLDIALGCVSSYGQVAARVGAPRALRAVGAAIGRNPVSVIVPCHRVLGSDGALTGYAGGLDRKRALLALERALRRMRPRHAAELVAAGGDLGGVLPVHARRRRRVRTGGAGMACASARQRCSCCR